MGSDDSHDFKEPGVNDPSEAAPGQAWIVVRAPELTAEAIKTALLRGDFYASTGVSLEDYSASEKQIVVKFDAHRSGARYRTQFLGKDGYVLQETAGNSAIPRLYDPWQRHLYAGPDSNGKQAWTQPVFVK